MKRRGFSLVEVIVALAVFTVGMLAVLEVTSRSQSLSAMTVTRTRAALLAQEGIEQAASVSYDSLTLGTYRNEPNLTTIGSEFTPFSRTVTVQYIDSGLNVIESDKGMKLVTSTVSWTSAARDVTKLPKTYSITTIIDDL